VSLLARLGHKSQRPSATPTRPPCPHSELAPRWDSLEDMGRADRVTFYVCTNCGERLSPEAARAR